MTKELFDRVPDSSSRKQCESSDEVGVPRLRLPERHQVEMHFSALDQLLEPDHPARAIWSAIEGLNLKQWLKRIQSVEGGPGRSATDPRLLVAVWVYATLDGVGSARRLAKLCDLKHGQLGYRWLCGGVTLNYHTLSDFRVQQGDAWDELVTQLVASLLHAGLVTMTRVAQDGMRVEANAGKSTFRRRETLQHCLDDARKQLAALKQLIDEDPQQLSQRETAARERAARERIQRVEQAIKNCEELQERREERSKVDCKPAKEARASTSDPDARNMKFPDGGYGPGHNVQYCTDVGSGVIVGVAVTNAGNDSQQCTPMLDQLRHRYDRIPEDILIDGGFVSRDTIDTAETRGCRVYAPVKDEEKQRLAGKDPFAKKKGDSPAVAKWRERMGTDLAKWIYRQRGQTAEWVNAQARNRGFYTMPVRGLTKCRTIAVLYALTHNILESIKLRAQAAIG